MTIHTILEISDEMIILDGYGVQHQITRGNVHHLLTGGWIFFLAAWVFNIIFYVMHPNAVDFSFQRFKNINICSV